MRKALLICMAALITLGLYGCGSQNQSLLKTKYLAMEISADGIEYQAPEDSKVLSGTTKNYEITLLDDMQPKEILNIVRDFTKEKLKDEIEILGADRQQYQTIETVSDVYKFGKLVDTVILRYKTSDKKEMSIFVPDDKTKKSGKYLSDEEWISK